MVDVVLCMECWGNCVEVKVLIGNGVLVLFLFVDYVFDGLYIKERIDILIMLVCDEVDGEFDEDSCLKVVSVMDVFCIVINKIMLIC